jgi:hypothetical protein
MQINMKQAMNARESENYLPLALPVSISRSSSASVLFCSFFTSNFEDQ